MALKLHNTLTRKTEVFHPLKPGVVTLYACGPTVYWFAHIGNMRAYLFVDVLRRTLSYNDFDVRFVMNITDVGHLTGDEDEGEDKMLVAMRREGKTAYDIAAFYTQVFLQDLERLNIKPADRFVKATDHIAEQIAMIKKIEEKGMAYRTSDGVYFDTSKLPGYGRLSGQKAGEKKAGARVEMGEKKHLTDFALWKFSPAGVKREMEWESPWGRGFPGWHIECSAMSTKYLGVPFDIHTGGVDHIPVHHENELAQTEAAEGKLQANVWLHSEFLTVDGGKMSKSLGNVYTIEDLIGRGYDPLTFRYFALGAHYRTKLNFTFEALDAAQSALKKLRETVRDWDPSTHSIPQGRPEDIRRATSSGQARLGCEEYEARFLEAINDDVNMPKALAIVWEMVDDQATPSSEKAASLAKFDHVLGLGLGAYVGKRIKIPAAVTKLVKEREAARAAKQWKESDRLRDEIAALGFTVEDTSDGPKIRAKG